MIGKPYEYDAMAACEKELWWYRCLHDLTIDRIQKNNTVHASLLDAGCGTGGLLSQLKKHGYKNIAAFDLSPDAVAYARANSDVDIQLLDLSNLHEKYAPASFDVVISHDTVCMLGDQKDKEVLAKLVDILKPGGLLLMNFPALKAFGGTHDVAVGIQKRYTKKSIGQLVSGIAEVKEITSWPFLLSPVIFFTRSLQRIKLLFKKNNDVLSDVKMPPSFINRLCYRLTSFENTVFKTKPWGSSLFVVIQKPVVS